MKKRACLLAAAFSIFLGIEAYGGQFIKDETGLWYQNADGTWPVGWFQSDTGSWYCFDEKDMPVPDGMKRMGSGTIWGSQMDACLRTAHPIWKTAGTRLTAREKAPMPVRITAAGSGTAFTGSTGDPAGLM